jgi:hypothetical protein
MKAIFLRNGDYSDRASLLLATFCNLMLSGQAASLPSLAPHSVRLRSQEERAPPSARHRLSPRLVIELDPLFLPPVQLGIGVVKNGAEIGGRMAQLVFDSEDNLVLLSMDNENGFNTLLRGLISSGLAVFVRSPRICSIGSSMPTAALSSSSKGSSLLAHMATGYKQGDTFESLLYAVQDALSVYSSRCSRCSRRPNPRPCR